MPGAATTGQSRTEGLQTKVYMADFDGYCQALAVSGTISPFVRALRPDGFFRGEARREANHRCLRCARAGAHGHDRHLRRAEVRHFVVVADQAGHDQLRPSVRDREAAPQGPPRSGEGPPALKARRDLPVLRAARPSRCSGARGPPVRPAQRADKGNTGNTGATGPAGPDDANALARSSGLVAWTSDPALIIIAAQ